ncbi:signal peptidase I [Dietzia aurantiaca]|uniref:signal peptidase I n=1 Tax=Dietzia aurantiaca TaxID=983873 RepID=UPI001E3963CD|nr:signal peptidase I [Dietzia aurantiaca]MCD2261479.1 signal peptidase I [Dietzia aurantiaca]
MVTVTEIEAPATSGRRQVRVWTRIEDLALTALSILGAVCIAATITAFALNISLIMFKTGSMSPTIPAGSLAIVREIPASDIRVGDVTTVSRGDDNLPVTHRVISTTPIGSGAYSIEMKGDANGSADMEPYEVTEVKKVLWHAPRLARLVATVSQPIYMAGITVAAALLVVWSFWPRRQQ